MDGRLQLFTGTAHPGLAQLLSQELELPLGRAIVDTFKNGEPDDKAANGKEADEDKPFSDPQLDRAVEHIRKQLADE